MNRGRVKHWFKIILAIVGAIIPIGLTVGLIINILNTNERLENIKQDINTNLAYNNKQLSSNQLQASVQSNLNTLGPYWNIEKINYIKNQTNYLNQFIKVDFTNLFNINNQQLINKATNNSPLNNIDELVLATSLNFNEANMNAINRIKSINLSSEIDNLINLYPLLYKKTNNKHNFTLTSFNANEYVNAVNNSVYDTLNNEVVFNFDLSNEVNNEKYLLDSINNGADASNYYKINYFANEIVVEWKQPNAQQKDFADTSTYDFWLNILKKANSTKKIYNRIVVKPANLIIYYHNDPNDNFVTLNNVSAIKLFNGTNAITIEDWMKSGINANPSESFDFRKATNFCAKNITSLNIPLIVNYTKSNDTISEPNQIVNNLLYSYNFWTNDRNWGNDYYNNLTDLMISMKASDQQFNLNKANNLDVNTKYTNAIANSQQNDLSQEIFSNQFFSMPKLKNLWTNDISIFFNNFKEITKINLDYYLSDDISLASFNDYKNLNLNFVCINTTNPSTQTIYNDFNFQLQRYFDRNKNNTSLVIDKDNINILLNNYFNYFNANRDITNITYEDFLEQQNQWVANDFIPIAPSTNPVNDLIRYEFLYGTYKDLTNIIFPFSLIKTINGTTNPLYLNNFVTNKNSNSNLISRLIDPTTKTIVYNNKILTNASQETYQLNHFNNSSFAKFVDIKKNLATPPTNPNEPVAIDLTFQDWIDYKWAIIDQGTDIFKIMKEKNVKFNTFFVPNIIVLNDSNVQLLNYASNDKDLIISLVLIILISLFVIAEIIIIVAIVKTKNKEEWFYNKIADHYNY